MSKHPNSQPTFIFKTQSSNLISSSSEQPRKTYYEWQTEIFPTYQGIYFIYDKFDALLYVGRSQDVNKRLCSHCSERDSHIQNFSAYFYKVETVEVDTGELDTLLWEIYYINKYHPIFNKKDVVYLSQDDIKLRIADYIANYGTTATARTSTEIELAQIGFPPEDGHLFNLWNEVQTMANNNHQYHSNQGMKATNNVIEQWIKKEKPTFMENIMYRYALTSIEDVEEQLRKYVRFDERNIFSTSSNPNVGWNSSALSLLYK